MSETTDMEEHFLELIDLDIEQGFVGVDEDPPDEIGVPMLTPRQTAGQWHTGQTSTLYTYASSGTVLPDIEAEIQSAWFSTTKPADHVDLARLWCEVAASIRLNNIEEGEIFWSRTLTNSDDTPLRVRRNGKLTTWKTRPGQYRLPVKYGLKTGTYITEANASDWCHSIDQ